MSGQSTSRFASHWFFWLVVLLVVARMTMVVGANYFWRADNQDMEPILSIKTVAPAGLAKPLLPVSYEQFFALMGKELVFGDRAGKLISWTFDAGEGDESFIQVMDVLKANGIRTTVFVTGAWIERFPQHFQRLLAEGHEIGNHSYNHPEFTKLDRDQLRWQLQRTEEIILASGGQRAAPLFRYPYGDRNPRTHKLIQQEGYLSVFWSLDTLDWREKPARVKQKVLAEVEGGDIILSHLGAASTGAVLAELVAALKERGYQFVTISELILANRSGGPT